MAGPSIQDLSSNWKKLQRTLPPRDTKPDAPSNGVKRKRPADQSSRAHGFKKTRLSDRAGSSTLLRHRKKHAMGNYLSSFSTADATPPSPKTSSQRHSRLIHDHDIAPEDVSVAYGSASSSAQDSINAGLHPTHKPGKYIAIDCEMVGWGPPPHSDHLLARASVVNFHGQQIYDSYVQPPAGISVADYRTHVSGIQPHHLRPASARTFAQVQQDMASLLDGRILVGHAVANDLRVLMLSHPRRDMRDTSRHPKFRLDSRGRPPALRNLAKSELGLTIQTGEHSSVEDARATMMLFRKEKKGFEEENRKRFGVRGKPDARRAREASNEDNGDSGDDGEALEEADVLDGEDDDDDEENVADESLPSRPSQPKAKKRKKTKKRTKRK